MKQKRIFLFVLLIVMTVAKVASSQENIINTYGSFEKYFVSRMGLIGEYNYWQSEVGQNLAKNKVVQTLFKALADSTLDYYTFEISPDYESSFLYDVVQQHNRELLEILVRHTDIDSTFFSFFSADLNFYNTQADVSQPQLITNYQVSNFVNVIRDIQKVASDELSRDLEQLVSFAYKFEGESVKSAFAYLINEKIILDYPVGGEKIFERTRQTIEWHNVDFKDPVIISFDDGTSWAEVTGGATPNTGEFEWLVPAVSDTLDSCRIMIEEAILNKPKDKSKWFSIIPLPSDTVIAALQFTDTLASTAMNMVSPLLSVEPRNAAGQLLPNLGEDVLLTLSSSSPSGEFSLQKYPFEPASHITLKSGRSRIQFYYRNYEAGLDTLSLAAPAELGWSAAQLPISVSNSIWQRRHVPDLRRFL